MSPVLPAFYFGTAEHYRLLAQHPKVVIDLGEHYERQSYRTRTSIVGPNGKQDLVVQIARRSGEKMPMRSVGLSYIETWPQQHIHAIRSAYGNAPWFIHYMDEIEAVVLKKYERLADLDLATMRLGMKWLGLGTELVVEEQYQLLGPRSMVLGLADPLSDTTPQPPEPGPGTIDLGPATLDLRSTLHPKRPLPRGISAVPPYPQIFADRHGFVPHMSIIDLVMNTGPEARRCLLS